MKVFQLVVHAAWGDMDRDSMTHALTTPNQLFLSLEGATAYVLKGINEIREEINEDERDPEDRVEVLDTLNWALITHGEDTGKELDGGPYWYFFDEEAGTHYRVFQGEVLP